MKNDIYLLHYNNYFNRTVKKAGNYAEDYIPVGSTDHRIFEDVNFVPGDGILTSLILGTGQELADLELENFDYLLVARHHEPDDDDDDHLIISRWFIMNCSRTRLGQYQFNLKRDSIVDNYSTIIDAPVYVQKAYINEVSNPLIFNKEGLNVNQIKQSEFPIQDETKSGWVVGYVPRDSFSEETPVDSDVFLATPADIEVAGISSWAFWKNVLGLNPNGEYLMENNGIHNVRFRNKSRYGRTVYSAGTTTYFAKRYVYFRTGVALDKHNAYVNNVQTGNVRGAPAQGALESWYEDWTNQEYMAYTAPTAASDVGYF